MKLAASCDTSIIQLLHELGLCPEAVIVTVDGELVPETATAKKGQEIRIIHYKHVPPLLSAQEPQGPWKKAKYERKCAQCNLLPSVYLPHGKTHLCAKHFNLHFEKQIKRSIRDYEMIERGQKIGLGVSGGKDSFALLYALSKLRNSLPFELVAITIDEGIPGYRDEALERAEKTCKKLGIKQHKYSFKKEYGATISQIAKKGASNLCSYCGVLRRKLLNKKARELKLDKIAIGHNLDDVAQTAMLNLIRNEPLRFARFNDPLVESSEFVNRIRPLLALREKEVASYAYLHGYGFNSGCCCPHSSNAMRWGVRHQINFLEDRYPGTKQKMSASFSTLQKIVRAHVSKENLEIQECRECGEPSSSDLCMACKMLSKV